MEAVITKAPTGWVLAGEIDAASLDSLNGAFAELPEPATDPIRLDLSAVTFIDSSGLGALIALHHRATQAGGVVVVENPSTPVRRLFELTRLDDLFAIDGHTH